MERMERMRDFETSETEPLYYRIGRGIGLAFAYIFGAVGAILLLALNFAICGVCMILAWYAGWFVLGFIVALFD